MRSLVLLSLAGSADDLLPWKRAIMWGHELTSGSAENINGRENL